ncbi:hypothetical protein [Corynebacterium sp. CCM 9203]|uniref:hypothetical protein n=1 Tax=Corynebacterium sp. CCM 9203 TaxID=3057615 RepID=UPI003524304E
MAIILAALGVGYTRSSVGYSALAALTVAFGATSAIIQLYLPGRITVFRGLAALGGMALLILGVLTAASRIINLDELMLVATLGAVYITPPAIMCCLIGGLGELPRKWAPRTGFSILGAGAVGWAALGADTPATRLLVILAAFLALLGCLPVLFDACRRRNDGWGWRWYAVTIAAGILATIMMYAITVAATPITWWPARAPSIVLAWGYILAAALPVIAGITYRSPGYRQ